MSRVERLDGADTVTHRRVLAIAVPMTLAYLSTPILGIVDTTVIGRLGSASLLGGIAVGAIIFNVLFTSFNFLRSGTTGLTAQALGANDRLEIRACLYRALLIAVVSGVVLIVLAGRYKFSSTASTSSSISGSSWGLAGELPVSPGGRHWAKRSQRWSGFGSPTARWGLGSGRRFPRSSTKCGS